jgi:hypothetical protein
MKSELGLVVAGLALVVPALPAKAADPRDLKNFGLICFCTSKVSTPHALVNAGNNGRVLMLARGGVTARQLARQGAPASPAQLRKLQDWGLLTRKGQRYTTAFPILGSAEMAALRSRLRPLADRVAHQIGPDLRAVRAELRARHQSASEEAVLFAYILDGLTWRQLESAGGLPSQEIDAAHPYWNGTFWAVYPRQISMPGTNSASFGNVEVRMMWTDPVLPWFQRLTGPPPGAVTVDERHNDPIYLHGQKVADRIATAVTAAKLADVIPSAGPRQRVLIATHELIWMVLDRANRDLGIVPPTVLKQGAQSLTDIAPLVVSVRSDRP